LEELDDDGMMMMITTTTTTTTDLKGAGCEGADWVKEKLGAVVNAVMTFIVSSKRLDLNSSSTAAFSRRDPLDAGNWT
jgi:hypothetical protein